MPKEFQAELLHSAGYILPSGWRYRSRDYIPHGAELGGMIGSGSGV